MSAIERPSGAGKNNLKIAIITPAYVPAFAFGGPVTQIQMVARALVERGYTVTVYTTNATGPSSFASLPRQEHIDGVLVKPLSHDPSKAKHLGASGRLFVEENSSLEKIGLRMKSLFEKASNNCQR